MILERRIVSVKEIGEVHLYRGVNSVHLRDYDDREYEVLSDGDRKIEVNDILLTETEDGMIWRVVIQC